jgi:hypothetical protein
MSSEKEIVFDIKPVLGEINSMIQKEIQKILRKFIEKYALYEETHNIVMNIPAVKKLMNTKEMFLASNGQRDDLSTTIQEFYRKIQNLTRENENLKKELSKHKSEEHIHLKISETERDDESGEDDEKMYEKILHLTESFSKKTLMDNMFKVTSEKDDSDSDEGSKSDEDSDSWRCEQCFYRNDSSKIECEKCFSSNEMDFPQHSCESLDQLVTNDDKEEKDEEEEEEEEDEDEDEDEEDEDEEEKDEEEDEEEKDEDEDEDEEDVFEIEIDEKDYFTNDETNGSIYEIDESGNPGKKIGHLKDGEPFFY